MTEAVSDSQYFIAQVPTNIKEETDKAVGVEFKKEN